MHLLMIAAALGFVCCAQDNSMTTTDIVTNPLFRMLLVGIVMSTLEALKQWKWFADKALSAPIARSAMALVLSLPAPLIAWASNGDLQGAGLMLMTTWFGAMGLNGLVGAMTNASK